MTGEAHWFVPVVVLLGGIGLFALGWVASRGARHLQRFRVTVDCPVEQRAIECTLVKDLRDARFVNVVECAAFSPGEVRCRMACLEALNRAAGARAKAGPPRPAA